MARPVRLCLARKSYGRREVRVPRTADVWSKVSQWCWHGPLACSGSRGPLWSLAGCGWIHLASLHLHVFLQFLFHFRACVDFDGTWLLSSWVFAKWNFWRHEACDPKCRSCMPGRLPAETSNPLFSFIQCLLQFQVLVSALDTKPVPRH